MRAEVGLLTRSVVYKGADDDSIPNRYGAHIMLHSVGDDSLTGRISYVELTQVGQAFQLGRYPIHFHMIGNVHNSYIRGNAIHHTYNRACTVHGVHYLTIEGNVAFETMGHAFFIEDAAETKNYLKNNLAIKTWRSFSLLNTDQTPASFWITHPDNQFINNHAAGSTNYGFWFDLQAHATGPSADNNICPEYERLGEFSGNVAHSNGKYGLRIFNRYVPTNNPCVALKSGVTGSIDTPDPTTAAHVDTYFRNFTGYKNKFTGVIAEELGALKFVDIKTADNLQSGVEFGLTDSGPWLAEADDYQLMDALIIGYSDLAESGQASTGSIRGLKGARREKMRARDILFADFSDNNSSSAIGTCSHCKGPAEDSAGRTYFFRDLYFSSTPSRVRFDFSFKEIIYDEDGSLGNETHRWIVNYYKHLDISECNRDSGTYGGLICSRDVSVRRMLFYNSVPYRNFRLQPAKILNLNRTSDSTYGSNANDHASCQYDRQSLSSLYAKDDSSWSNQKDLLGMYETHGRNYANFKGADDARNSCTGSCGNDASGNNIGGCYVEDDTRTSSYYCDSANRNAILAFNPEDSCESSCAVKCDLYLCTEATHNESFTRLNNSLTQRDDDYGYYDKRWEADGYFCNAENYQSVRFAELSNPSDSWVFPVITGQEYNVHWRQGVDVTKMTGEYSYPELLQGETRGVVLHFNHTGKAEEWYYKFTNSSGRQIHKGVQIRDHVDNGTAIPSRQTKLTVDSTSQMGDIVANNVTRHVAIKLDGQRNDTLSFELERDGCVTEGGCGPRTQAPPGAEIEEEERYWSDRTSWSPGNVPVEGDDVVIEGTWNMVLDIPETPLLRSLEINGRLTVKNSENEYVLKSYLIWVRSGELIVGTEETPFMGNVTFELHGDKSSSDVYFHDEMFEAGNKVIANTGKLRMYGKNVGTKWTRLAETAQAGQSYIILVDDPTDWAVNDELGIAPSGRNYEERDFAVIQSINGNNVTLQEPLQYTHYGAASINSGESSTIDIRTEVVHLTRNIKVQGSNVDRWGGHIVTAHNLDIGCLSWATNPNIQKGTRNNR